VPDSRDFPRFAIAVAPGLLRLARAMTGDETVAELLAEDALLATFRSWPRGGRLSPGVKAHRALVAARPRERVILRRPSSGLQLQDVSLHSASSAEAGTNESELLWEGLADLAERHRLLLLLRYAAGLTLAETSLVLGLPRLVVDRLHPRALRALRLTCDIDVPERTDDDLRTGATEFEASVCRAIQSRVDQPEVDADGLVDRVLDRASRMAPASHRSHVLAGAVVGTVIATLAAAAFLFSSGRGESSRTLAPLPPAPPGTQLVGYRGMAVVVPATWTLHESPCGRTVAPSRAWRTEDAVSCAGTPLSPSVTLTDAPVNFPPGPPPPARTSRVSGQVFTRTAVAHYNGIYQQAVFVFGARFMMIVRSPDQAVVSAITRSVRAVPDGYTVVPTCRSLPLREAVAALGAVGLTASITHTSSIPMWHGEPPVIFQNEPSGSIVRQGTRIALTIPGR
jgi:DNA-directed RNA polymerase specialized sigma24 family protein